MSAFRVNLLPWRQRRLARDTRRWWLWLLFLMGGLLATLVAYRWMLSQQRSALEKMLRTQQREQYTYSEQLREIQQKAAALRGWRWKQLREDNIRAHNRGYEQLLTQLAHWLPDELWLTAVTVQDGKIKLEGKGYDYGDIVRFSSLLETKTSLTSIRLVQTRQEDGGASDSTIPTLAFHLLADWNIGELSRQASSHDE